MLSIRRLALLIAAVGALALLPAAGAGAAESCTTAVGGGGGEHSTAAWLLGDVPLDGADCAAAVLHATPGTAPPGTLVTLDGSDSLGPNGTNAEIATYEWDFGDGSPLVETSGSSTTHTYARGHWVASLTIKDGPAPGGVALAPSVNVDVFASEMPVAAFDAPAGVIKPGVPYDFDAGASTAPDGSIANYHWIWGDGTPPTDTASPTVQHTFADDGVSSSVTLIVTNDVDLQSSAASHAIVVDNVVPVVALSATPSAVAVGQQLTLSAAGSFDPDGTIAQYVWDRDGDGHYEFSTGGASSVTAGGYPNAGVITLGVKVVDDSGDFSTKTVNVTVGSGSAGGGSGGGGSGSGSKGGGGKGGSGGGGSGGGGSGGGGSSATAGSFALGLSGTAIQQLTKALKRGVGLRASANRTATGTLTLSVSAGDAKRLRIPGRKGRKPVAIGTLKISLSPGRTTKPSIKLTRKAAAALRRARPRTLRVTIRGALTAGGEKATAARIVLLRG